MSKQKYYELVDQLCVKLGIEDAKSMYEICELQADGVRFTLLQGGKGDDDSLYIYCDFGGFPGEAISHILALALEQNLYFLGKGAPHFGYNTTTKHIVLVTPVTISTTTAESVLDQIQKLAAFVPQWRNEMLISAAAASPGGALMSKAVA